MKRIIVIIAALLMSAAAFAQDDALCTWTTVSFDKSIGKWSVGLMSEYRHKIHEGESMTDQYFARPRFSYKALNWLTLRYQVDLASTSSGFNLRFMPEVTAQHKVGDFTFAYRQRIMTTWKVEKGTNSTVLRSRAKVDYHIPSTPASIHFAIEPYWCDFSKDSFAWFQKARWYAGFDIKLTDDLTLRPEYVCQAYHNHKGKYARRTYDDHVIYMTFVIKLR
jgi:hypothetical protein